MSGRESPQLIVILARQRSGSTALAETLAAGSAVESFGEVFHHRWAEAEDAGKLRIRPEASFFRLKIDQLRERPELSFPSVENQSFLFDRFTEHLASLTQKRWLLLDVKYNSWHHFEHVYSAAGSAPFMLHLLKQNNAAFVHIIRDSSFERYCSERLALERDTWHTDNAPDSETAASIIIDPEAALRDMLESRRQSEAFTRFLAPTSRRIEVRYEQLYRGDRLTEAAEIKIRKLLDGEWTDGTTVPLKKISPPLGEVVRNRDEVLAYFANTTFSREVEQALCNGGT